MLAGVCVAERPYFVFYITSQLRYFFRILHVKTFVCICIECAMFIHPTFGPNTACVHPNAAKHTAGNTPMPAE